MNFEMIKHRLLNLDPAHLCDASNKVSVFASTIRPINSGLKMIGIAHTVNCENDNLAVLKALKNITANEVLVIAGNNSEYALIGEIITTAAKQAGAVGIVCDGACRDVPALQDLHFPVFAKSICPRVATKIKPGAVQTPINCGGITVNPGDIIFADDDGIIAITAKDIEPIITTAEAIKKKESNTLQRIRLGESLFRVMSNFDEYYSKVKNNEPATLIWEE